MLTLKQAQALKPGDILLDDRQRKWKVNGKVRRWKRSPDRVRVPLKHGLYSYDAITEGDFHDGKCSFLTWARLA